MNEATEYVKGYLARSIYRHLVNKPLDTPSIMSPTPRR
jgi:hypothetical protein